MNTTVHNHFWGPHQTQLVAAEIEDNDFWRYFEILGRGGLGSSAPDAKPYIRRMPVMGSIPAAC